MLFTTKWSKVLYPHSTYTRHTTEKSKPYLQMYFYLIWFLLLVDRPDGSGDHSGGSAEFRSNVPYFSMWDNSNTSSLIKGSLIVSAWLRYGVREFAEAMRC